MSISEVPLNPELWIQVFEALRESNRLQRDPPGYFRPEMKNLCLTCRVFREIAQPFLFEALELNGGNFEDLFWHVQKLNNLFQDRPGSSNWVKLLSLDLQTNDREAPSPRLLRAASMIADVLFPQMEGIRFLIIQHTLISMGTYAQIYRLRNLISLRLDAISFPGYPVTPDLHVQSLSVRSFTLNNLQMNEDHAKTAAARLAFSPAIEKLDLDLDPSIAPTVFKLGPSLGVSKLYHLYSLSLIEPTGPLLDDFFVFARLAPNITTLKTRSYRTGDVSHIHPTSIHVPGDILLDLNTLRCSPLLAEALVLGRVVTDLACQTFSNAAQTTESIERIVGHARGLQSLSLRWAQWSDDIFGVISSAAPELVSLSLWFIDDSYKTWLNDNLVEVIQPFKKLKRLLCIARRITERISYPNQREALETLTESNPLLVHFTFDHVIEWKRSPDRIWRQQ